MSFNCLYDHWAAGAPGFSQWESSRPFAPSSGLRLPQAFAGRGCLLPGSGGAICSGVMRFRNTHWQKKCSPSGRAGAAPSPAGIGEQPGSPTWGPDLGSRFLSGTLLNRLLRQYLRPLAHAPASRCRRATRRHYRKHVGGMSGLGLGCPRRRGRSDFYDLCALLLNPSEFMAGHGSLAAPEFGRAFIQHWSSQM